MNAKPSPSLSLVALKPRQVVVSSSSRPTTTNMASTQSLNPQQKSLLLLSVARFLETNSFSKTLKKFLSEAKVQKNNLTGSSLDLEEMCCKYLAISDHSISKSNREQFQDMLNGNLNNGEQEGVAPAVANKKRKKRDNENTSNAIVDQNVVDDISAEPKMSEQVSREALEAPIEKIMGGLQQDDSAKKKEKKKKKSKVNSESGLDKAECTGGKSEKSKDAASVESNGVSDTGIESKTKDKKKKKNINSDSMVDGVKQHGSEDKPQSTTILNGCEITLEKKTLKSKDKKKKKDHSEELEKGESDRKETKDNKNGISKEDSTIIDGKGSKKRKRLEPQVHESLPVDENAAEECKRRKTESGEEQQTKLKHIVGADEHVTETNNGETVDVGVNDSQEKPSKQLHEQENGNREKTGKNSEQKSSTNLQNDSVQSKKFFQRVNVDEIVFVDKRLEDNSYWAKDGAETGYGAKAQEVLGQVRGRDFRHEKTKKKRGSYRGGQIDFQSHSIKFNYSDEE